MRGFHGGTAKRWRCALLRLFLRGARAQVVVLGVGVNYFLENGVRQDYAPMLFFNARDTLAVASDLQLHRTATSNLLLAHSSVFWDTRGPIRMQVLNHMVPHLENLFSLVNQRPAVPEGREFAEMSVPRLQRLRELCEANGARLILVVPPTLNSEDAVRRMAAAAQAAGVEVSVPVDPAALSAKFYQPDGMHLNRDGAAIFTLRLARDFPKRGSGAKLGRARPRPVWPLPEPPAAHDSRGIRGHFLHHAAAAIRLGADGSGFDGGRGLRNRNDQRCVLCAAAAARQNGRDFQIVDGASGAIRARAGGGYLRHEECGLGNRRRRSGPRDRAFWVRHSGTDAHSALAHQMVFAEQGTGPAIQRKGATPTVLAQPSAGNRGAAAHAEFQHSQFFHQAWNWRTLPGHLLRAWIDDLGGKHGRCFTRAVCVHPLVQSLCGRKCRGLRLAGGGASHLWRRSWRLRHAHF